MKFSALPVFLLFSVIAFAQKVELPNAKFMTGDNIAYSYPSWEDTKWQDIKANKAWDSQGFASYDGFAWYKRTFTLPEKSDTKDLVLLLGKIDDFDKVYLNGQLIGKTNDHKPYGSSESYQQNRVYEMPPDLLKKSGVNTIEVLVEDMGNYGGMYEGIIGIATKADYERYFDR